MSRITHLSDNPSILDEYMADLRSVDAQNNRESFRENIRKVGRILGYEISKSLNYEKSKIQTPLAEHAQNRLQDDVVLITILRAGLPLHEGMLSCFPKAENGFVSAYRKHDNDGGFEIEVGYVACPDLTDKVLILNDPMLATGSSFETAIKVLEDYGTPKSIHVAAVIASAQGVENVSQSLPEDVQIWIAAIDPDLNDQKYIVPGLGDAGDLAFGEKLQS
ncbi:MAG TPA: uracil phosphoribosyltransferase [Flavobacteriales bacterium]|nr:uracil phosphoribosyltransferase [Flavobacteriales bacterium]